jgi:large subunit ribosomal protein L29
MKFRELAELSEEELVQKETELKDQLFKLKFQHALGQLEHPMKLKNIKKDIAKIQTLLTQKAVRTEE